MRELDDKTLVAGQIAPADMPELARRGVSLIINNRPDNEDPEQPLAADIAAAAEAAGMSYRHVPIVRGIGPADVEALRQALAAPRSGKALLFCRSGHRSALAWAVARRADGASLEEIDACARRAGIDLSPVAHLL